MFTYAPHRTTSEYSAYGAESISRIIIEKVFVSNHVVIIVILGKSIYQFVATLKPSFVSSELVNIITVVVCWK